MADVILDTPIAAAPAKPAAAFRKLLHNPAVMFGGAVIAIVLLMALLAPWLGTIDPTAINPIARNKVPGAEITLRTDTGERIKMIALFGTDSLGRDVYSRVVYGARISLLVGVSVALISVACGLFIGLLAGFFRILDAIIMRIMDGLMAIPAILLAIAMVSLFRSSVWTVIIAITVPQVPGVVRLVRSIVLSVREEPYVEAAVTLGTSTPKLLWRHVLPNTDRADDRAGHLHLRVRHSHRGHPVVPRHRRAAGGADLGQHHGRGQAGVQPVPAQHHLSRRVPRR